MTASPTVRLDVPQDDLFGIHNLPYGVYSLPGRAPRVGTRYGEHVVDLATLLGDEVFAGPSLNPFMAQGHDRWAQVRSAIAGALRGEVPREAVHSAAEVTLHLPFDVADYVDFYASEHHAANLGRLFRPDNPEPLMPNWKHLPVGYHGRAASVVVSGTDIVRPAGQRKGPSDPAPVFGPSVRLDIEAELGFVVGTGNALGEPVAAGRAERHLFGVVLFNDWSARDIQAWEYVPLGPFLGKSFATSVSAWVTPLEALEAARVVPPARDEALLPYLDDSSAEPGGYDLRISVEINGEVVSEPPFTTMYWTAAQMLAQTTVNGASLRTGDLYGSGTVSGAEAGQRGSLLELTWNGERPLELASGKRGFLEDGDEVVLRAWAPGAQGVPVGLGEVRGTVVPGA